MKRGNVKILGILLAILTAAALLAGCSGADKTDENAAVEKKPATTKDVLVIGDKGTPKTLAPYLETSFDRCRVTDQIYENLFFAEPDGSFSPGLATSWEWKDSTHVVFKLRQGVKFHNGNPFTADDVLFTIQYALKAPAKDIFGVIDGDNCKVIDDYTFELALKRPDTVIMSYIGNRSMMSILDKETCEADPKAMESSPVGTGPYKLKDWVVGDTVTLERFDDYWGDKPAVKTVVFRKISESTQRVIELETGGVDFIYDAPFSSVDSLKEKKFTVIEQPSYLISNLYFNATPGKTMDNADLRKAIAYAIDYDAITKGSANGSGAAPASLASRAAVGSKDINPDGTPWWPYDVAKAKEYMAKAGYPNGLTLNLTVNADHPFMSASVEQISNFLKEIGITLNVKPMSLGAMIGFILDVNNPWDIAVFGNAESSVILQAARMDKSQCPFLAYKRDDLQAILDKMWVAKDPKEQSDIIKQFGEYFKENVPFVPYHEDEDIFASVSNLKGMEFYGSFLKVSKVHFE